MEGTGLDTVSVRGTVLPFPASELLASWCPPKEGASLCQCIDGKPYPFSVNSSAPSPSPRCSVSPLSVLESFAEGEEWTDTEVIASLERSRKPSVSFVGSTLTGRDRGVLGTPLVNGSVMSMLFVWVIDGFWGAVKLLPFLILPEDEGWSEGGA